MAEEVITELGRSPATGEAEAFQRWIDRLPDSEVRTQFLLALLPQGQPAYGWLRAARSAASGMYSEPVIAHAIADAGMRASRADDRGLAAEAFSALAPRTPDGQREVANFIVWLLERERKADYEIALETVPSLGSTHGMGQRVGRAFRKAGDTLGRKVPARYKAAFEDAEIVLGKDYFARPPKKGKFSRLLGR